MGSRSTLHPRVARLQLNQYMESILQPVNDEIVTAFEDELKVTNGTCHFRSLSSLSPHLYSGCEPPIAVVNMLLITIALTAWASRMD